jgi:hypothetical protein
VVLSVVALLRQGAKVVQTDKSCFTRAGLHTLSDLVKTHSGKAVILPCLAAGEPSYRTGYEASENALNTWVCLRVPLLVDPT